MPTHDLRLPTCLFPTLQSSSKTVITSTWRGNNIEIKSSNIATTTTSLLICFVERALEIVLRAPNVHILAMRRLHSSSLMIILSCHFLFWSVSRSMQPSVNCASLMFYVWFCSCLLIQLIFLFFVCVKTLFAEFLKRHRLRERFVWAVSERKPCVKKRDFSPFGRHLPISKTRKRYLTLVL